MAELFTCNSWTTGGYLTRNYLRASSSSHSNLSAEGSFLFFILNLLEKMTHSNLKAVVEFTCNSKDLKPEEKILAIQNECQQAEYTEEDYDNAVYGKWISIFDTGMWVEDAEERNNTSLDPLFLEDGIDVDLLFQVRMLHNREKDISQEELDNYDNLDDCLSINHSGRDKRKFFVFNTPGYRTEYHTLPWWGMVSTLVKSNSPYIRKVIWNDEWSFEEIIDNDKPDWVLEMERNEEKIKKAKKIEHKTKILWKAIRDSREEYKPLYDTIDKLSQFKWNEKIQKRINNMKKKADKSYAEYKYYSRAMDKVKELDAKAEHQRLEKEAWELLHLFVTFQRDCPDDLVDSVLREDIKAKYKAEGYEVTRYYLKRLIRRVEVINQNRKYQEEEEATA